MNIKQWYLYLFTTKCTECEMEMMETGYPKSIIVVNKKGLVEIQVGPQHYKCYNKECKMFNIKI